MKAWHAASWGNEPTCSVHQDCPQAYVILLHDHTWIVPSSLGAQHAGVDHASMSGEAATYEQYKYSVVALDLLSKRHGLLSCVGGRSLPATCQLQKCVLRGHQDFCKARQ